MKIFKILKIPKLLLVSLLVLTAASAWATQVKFLTYRNVLGQASSDNHQITLTVGEPLVGGNNSGAEQSSLFFGFWEIMNETQVVSPVGDEAPVLINRLFRNYPNPFNPSTRVSFTLADESQLRIEVFDLKGRRVDTIFEGVKQAGAHSINYQPKNLASGAYVILMRAGSFRATQRMMLLK